MIVCVPAPAILGLKLPPLTPVPENVPPLGEPESAYVVRKTQTVSGLREHVTTGNALTETIVVADFVHPIAEVPVTVYVVVEVGDTV